MPVLPVICARYGCRNEWKSGTYPRMRKELHFRISILPSRLPLHFYKSECIFV